MFSLIIEGAVIKIEFMNYYMSLLLVIFCVLLLVYRFYFGLVLLKEMNDTENSIYEENGVSCQTGLSKILEGGFVFKVANIKLTDSYIVIKSNLFFAYYMNKKKMLLKIPFSKIQNVSVKDKLIIEFINQFDEVQRVYLVVQNKNRINEIITSSSQHK